MSKVVLHFTHGNGFPSLCYRQLLHPLESQFDCRFIEQVGHSPDFPVTDNWGFLVAEVIESIKRQSDAPVIAVGHSLGGVLSFLAALEQPGLFKQLILLDSPIFGWFKSQALRFYKWAGLIDRATPAMQTRGRRLHWATREQALAHFREKPVFKAFTQACLEDYVDYGLIKQHDGYTLRFDRQVEYQIYRTMPHQLYQQQGKLKVPTAVIFGLQSNVINSCDLRHMRRKYSITQHPVQGSHLFPFEYPQETAALIQQLADFTLI